MWQLETDQRFWTLVPQHLWGPLKILGVPTSCSQGMDDEELTQTSDEECWVRRVLSGCTNSTTIGSEHPHGGGGERNHSRPAGPVPGRVSRGGDTGCFQCPEERLRQPVHVVVPTAHAAHRAPRGNGPCCWKDWRASATFTEATWDQQGLGVAHVSSGCPPFSVTNLGSLSEKE